MTSRERPPAGTEGHETAASGLGIHATPLDYEAPRLPHPLPPDPVPGPIVSLHFFGEVVR